MKLRHFFDNRDLVEMILKNWDYDPDKLDLLKYYRISANAVYPFEFSGQRYFLRFSPVEERTEQTILAELEFIRYLREHNYPAVGTIPSKEGRELESVGTPWGDYLAVVFQGVPGNRLDRITPTDEIIVGLGKSLGQRTRVFKKYKDLAHIRLLTGGWLVNYNFFKQHESLGNILPA